MTDRREEMKAALTKSNSSVKLLRKASHENRLRKKSKWMQSALVAGGESQWENSTLPYVFEQSSSILRETKTVLVVC